MLGAGRLRHYAKWLRSFVERKTLILLYHRVADVPADPHLLCVSPDNFAQQMEVLHRSWKPISLRELNIGLRNKRLPRRSVLVTFDDGYADNLHNAKPILERYEIPAVVFVIAGSVGLEREFWWDELEKLILRPGTLPEEFTLRSNGAETRWILGQSAVYSQENYREHAHWYFGKKNVPTRRHVLYSDLYNLMKPLASHHQNEMLQMLRVWSGADAPATKSNLPMTTSELRDLRRGNLLEVGAHTMSHPVLSTLPQNRQRLEISDSKASLEKIVGEPITGFAYPYGADADYTDETVGIVRDADFESAFSTASGLADNESEMFRLPRNWVRNWTGEQFADRLQRWSLYE